MLSRSILGSNIRCCFFPPWCDHRTRRIKGKVRNELHLLSVVTCCHDWRVVLFSFTSPWVSRSLRGHLVWAVFGPAETNCTAEDHGLCYTWNLQTQPQTCACAVASSSFFGSFSDFPLCPLDTLGKHLSLQTIHWHGLQIWRPSVPRSEETCSSQVLHFFLGTMSAPDAKKTKPAGEVLSWWNRMYPKGATKWYLTWEEKLELNHRRFLGYVDMLSYLFTSGFLGSTDLVFDELVQPSAFHLSPDLISCNRLHRGLSHWRQK